MDLHFTEAAPTVEEIAAVDGVTAVAANGSKRTYLLPVLHAIQDRVGWVSPGALNYASRSLEVPPAEAFGVADFYALLSTRPQPPAVAHVCDDLACKIKGAEKLCSELEKAHGPEGSSSDGKGTWHRSPCLGMCEHAPAALVLVAGERHTEQALAPANTEEITTALQGTQISQPALSASVPQMGQPGLTLLRRVGQINPESLDEYRAAGGFLALRRAFEMGPGCGCARNDRVEAGREGWGRFPLWPEVAIDP